MNEEKVSEKATLKFFGRVQKVSGNGLCFDCGKERPVWASITNAIFVCYDCCAFHRHMGVRYSFVKSLKLDGWTQKQLKYMEVGGNDKMRELFKEYGIDSDHIKNEEYDIKQAIGGAYDHKIRRYKTKAAIWYRSVIKNQMEGTPVLEKPSLEEGKIVVDNKKRDFFGSISSKPDNFRVQNDDGIINKLSNKCVLI